MILGPVTLNGTFSTWLSLPLRACIRENLREDSVGHLGRASSQLSQRGLRSRLSNTAYLSMLGVQSCRTRGSHPGFSKAPLIVHTLHS